MNKLLFLLLFIFAMPVGATPPDLPPLPIFSEWMLAMPQIVGVQQVPVLDYNGFPSTSVNNPSTGKGRVFYSTTDSQLHCLNNDGSSCLTGGGGGTVTSVSGTANQISVATGTTTPVISIAAPALSIGCQSNCTYVLTTADQEWVQPSAGNALAAANTTQLIKFYNNATRGLGNACFRLGGTGSAGGHIDIGVYSITGTLLWHTGPQLTTAANANFCVTPTPVTLAAGTNYYIAWTEDNNVATLVASANVITLWGTINLSGAPAHTFGIDTTDATTGGTLLNTITPNNIVNTNAVIVPYVQVFL